jgi:hypothetical protein
MLALLLLGAVATPDCVNQYGWSLDTLDVETRIGCAGLSLEILGSENCPLNRTAVNNSKCGYIFDVCRAGGVKEACPVCLQCTGTPIPDCVGDRGWSFTTVGEDPITATCTTFNTIVFTVDAQYTYNILCHGTRDPSTGYLASQVCSECQQCNVPEGPLIPAVSAAPTSAAPTSSASAAGPHLLVVLGCLVIVLN